MAATEFNFDVETDKRLKQEQLGDRMQATESGTDPGGPQSLTNDLPEVAAAREQERQRPTPEPDEDDVRRIREENDYLKRKLGEQGSQMGELKQMATQAQRLQSQVDAMQRAQGAAARPQTIDLFSDIPQDQRYMSPAEQARLNQAIIGLATGVESELRRVRDEAIYSSTRTTTGISDEEEAAVTASAPWVERLTGLDRLSAVRTLVEGQRKERGQPRRTADEAARMVARRESYVEASTPTSGEPNVALETAQDRTLREVNAGKYRTAAEMEKALRKVGIGKVDDFGRRY